MLYKFMFYFRRSVNMELCVCEADVQSLELGDVRCGIDANKLPGSNRRPPRLVLSL